MFFLITGFHGLQVLGGLFFMVAAPAQPTTSTRHLTRERLIVAEDLHAPDLHVRLSQLQTDMYVWTGNDVQVVEHTPATWRKLVRTKNPLVDRIRSEGVSVAGDTSALLERP